MLELLPVIVAIMFVIPIFLTLTGCSEAITRSTEISQKADNFETPRRLKLINTRNDTVILEFTGTFSIQESQGAIDIIAAVGDDRYEKHFFTLNEWTIYAVEDLSNTNVKQYFTELVYYPEAENYENDLLPDTDSLLSSETTDY